MTLTTSNKANPQPCPVIVITGGTQGLGLALTRAFLRDGFAVSTCARTETDVDDLRTFFAHDYPLYVATGDVTDLQFQTHFIAETVRSFGRIDAVVNSASTLGILPMPTVLKSTPENDRHVFEVNVVAPMQLLRLAAPHLQHKHTSMIVGISSDAAIGGYPEWGIYGASKAASDLLHKTIAAEVTNSDVHIFSVDPGDMDTTMHHAADPNAKNLTDPFTVAQAMLSLFQPLKFGWDFPFSSGSRLRFTGNGRLEVAIS